MKQFFVMFALVVVFVSTAVAEKREVVITGYETGEFAVKGTIFKQVEKLVGEIKLVQPDSTILSLTVIGSADSRGISSQNDRLSKDRAEGVAAMLASNFPEAKINIVPKGDEENSRQVVVKYEFTKIVPDRNIAEIQSKLNSLSSGTSGIEAKIDSLAVKREGSNSWRAGVIVILCFALLISVFLVVKFLSKKKQQKKALKQQEKALEWKEETIELEIKTTSKGNFRVKVLRKWRIVNNRKEEVFISPFTNTGEKKTEIEMSHKRDIVNSLKRCLESDKFVEQLSSLQRKGVITKIQ